MLKIFNLNLIFFILLFGKINAQDVSFTGKILNKENLLPIENCNVTVYKDSVIVYKTGSDSLGMFKIPFSILKASSSIKFHSINYDTYTLNKSNYSIKLANSQYYLGSFALQPKIIRLNEVKVKSTKRYRDTTKIDLSKQKFERSTMVDDLFSNYGFSKDANGQLFYKGKPVADLELNGGTFFGKNNLDIYHLLPALIIENINVIETNIDSVTNTTMLRPMLKVNLILKDNYKSGKFGNTNLGIGSAKRDVANTNLFSYKNKEQVSLFLNSNNVNSGDNTILEPRVDFSANGNNVTANGARFTFRNVYANKLEINFSAKGELDSKSFMSESEIKEVNENLFSKTITSSDTKSFTLNDTKLDIHDNIDSLNTIDAIQTFDHSRINQVALLDYNIQFDSLNTASQLNKLRNTNADLLHTAIIWKKKYGSKKGRLLTIGFDLNNNNYHVGEFDNVDNTSGQILNSYFIDGTRTANENKYTFKSNFTEPIGEAGYISFSASYEKDKLNYDTQFISDTVLNYSEDPSKFTINYFKPGFKFQRTFNKISLDAALTGIYNVRNTEQLQYNNNRTHFFDLDFDLRADYKINKMKDLIFDFTGSTNYPVLQQLTSLNSTFDIISEASGNIFLKPEEKKSVKLSYSTRPQESEYISIAGEFDHYANKFGFEINNFTNIIGENITIANVGGANNAQISFSILKNIFGNKYLNYSSSVLYQEAPTLINNKLTLDNGITFNQSISTSVRVIDSLFSITPTIALSYNEFFYENHFNVTTLIYTDKMSLKVSALQLDLYPLINFNHSITNNESFSMNGAIKKSVFKNYGIIWIQAYDIFNSFKYINNLLGPSSYQTIRYSNLQRYVLLGLTFKFNNMK